MCGIVGIFHTDTSSLVSEKLLSNMISVLHHRGPDEKSLHINGNVGFGHCRLSVIDIDGGSQPMFNEDKSISIVYNGEIYNFKQLRDDLLRKGHIFQTNCDTEVIIHAYEQYGNNCVQYLRGMFAFAIWDRRKNLLFVARDRIGIKPLFYYWDGKKFIFSSEIKAIIQDPMIKREINFEAMEDYLTYGYIPAPKTIFKRINKLLPGNIITVSTNGIRSFEYWDVNLEPNHLESEDDYAAGILEKIHESVNLHMMSDVPLGAFLSGGIDSSTIVGIMSEYSNDPVTTVSIGFNETFYNELTYARLVAERFCTKNYEKILQSEDSLILDQLLWEYDEPFADPAMIPNYYISKLAKENLTVCLSGDGGDEIFAGYTRFIDFVETSQKSSKDAEKDYFISKSFFTREMKNYLYTENLKKLLGEYDSFHVMKKYFDRTTDWDPLSRIQYLELKTYLVDDILTKVDRSSMANSLEVRVPFLDHEFVKFVSGIPSSLKLKNNQGKYILKKALSNILPVEIINRPKMGLLVPLQQWFKHDLKAVFEGVVLNNNSFISEYFNLTTLHEIWNNHQSGLKDSFRQLWTILILELWWQKYFVS